MAIELNGVNQVSGGPPTSNEVIDLVANQIGNLADAELTYQFSRNRMIGGEGTFTNLNYLQVVPGLFNSSSSSGSVFYSQRLSRNDYIGATYAYSKILAYPPNTTSEIQMNTYLLFYTIYPKPTLSLSVSAGPQHYELVQYPVPSTTSWQPTITASAGWQGPHTNLAASYSRSDYRRRGVGRGLPIECGKCGCTLEAGKHMDGKWIRKLREQR